jgi:hypothetical protein
MPKQTQEFFGKKSASLIRFIFPSASAGILPVKRASKILMLDCPPLQSPL